jgi:hypothetical protein
LIGDFLHPEQCNRGDLSLSAGSTHYGKLCLMGGDQPGLDRAGRAWPRHQGGRQEPSGGQVLSVLPGDSGVVGSAVALVEEEEVPDVWLGSCH